MRKKPLAPSYQTLLPYAVIALKKLGGMAERHKVLYQMLIDLNLPEKAFDKARKELGWTGSRLRFLDILKPVDKRGIWELNDESLMNMEDSEIKELVRAKHRAALRGE